MRTLAAGAGLVAGGLLLHLIEPVATLECRRRAPGTAECRIARGFYGVIPFSGAEVPAAAALAAEEARLGRADPDAVTCTSFALLDPVGDATPFACVKDPRAVEEARAFFAPGSAQGELRVRHSQGAIVAASAAFTLAGLALAVAGAVQSIRRRRPSR
jgi:hypothetical protein